MSHLRSQIGLAVIVFTSAASIFLYRTISASDAAVAKDLAVNCGAEHRAVVRQTAGQPLVAVECVPVAPGLAVASNLQLTQGELATLIASSRATPGLVPAVYYPQAEVTRAVAPIARTVSSPTRAAAVRPVAKKPSWQKRAVVIGGSAGAGAGIGALIGGKKGALIGAAVGGGGATVVDLLRNR